MTIDRRFIHWNGEVPDAPKVRGVCHWARSYDLGTGQNQVKMNNHINSISEWPMADVLSAKWGY